MALFEFNEDTLKGIFRHLHEAVVIADLERRMVYVNPAAEQLFGYVADELLGHSTSMLYATHDAFDNVGAAQYQAQAPTGSSTFRVPYRRRDGAQFLGETIGSKIRSPAGDVQGFVGIIRVATPIERSLDAMHRLHAITADRRLSFDQRMAAILELGSSHFGLPLAIQSRIEGAAYTVEHCLDPAGGLLPGTEFELGGTYCTHTVSAGAPTGFHHAGESAIRQHPCYRAFKLEAYLGSPILVDGEVYGTLNFSRFEATRPFDADDLALIRLLAHWVGHAIADQRHRQELRRLARTDPLTGLLNRRAVLDGLGWQIAHGQRSDLPVSVVLLDVDHFKRINDTWGHDAGDAVLRSIAAICNQTKRDVDLASRFGGEEFLFVLPDTDLEGGGCFAERLLHAMCNTPIRVGATCLTVSASLGIAQIRPGEDAEAVISRADRAMYLAKEEGRSQVRLAS